ncbi:MAG: DNA mismatch endonuclease Vsr [Bacteroidaceae bacterium]|nr:DNA mismatch endonuclease Vsr [Bacteroidaceae bacterium]
MTDILNPLQRHKAMAAIRSKDTKPEMIVRRGLWKIGFRYSLNHKRLPGHPDLVLRKYRTCIFVNGCFWHGHKVDLSSFENSECCKIPKTNRDFWVAKIKRNKERDREEQKKLAKMGWHCITVWECELTEKRVQNDAGISSVESRGKETDGKRKLLTKREQTLDALAFTLNHIWLLDHGAKAIPYPKRDEEDMQMPMAAENCSAT